MNIMILLAILFYIFAVVGSTLYHEYSPEYFGTLHATLLTLFQIVTLESWASDIMRPLLHFAPYSWIYFLSFILSGTFIVVNLFIAVIVSSVQNVSLLRDGEDLKEETSQQEIAREIATLKSEITLLRQTLEEQSKRDQANKSLSD
jgi:voltage-gated sodium channel